MSSLAELGHPGVAVGDHLGEVVAGVDVHDREGEPARPERLDGQVQEDGRVLATAEEEDGPLRLGRDLAQDEDRVRLEQRQMVGVPARAVVRAPGVGRRSLCGWMSYRRSRRRR